MLHDYLHCLVFKEQSVYRLSFQATHLSYRIQLSLSISFLENFQSFAASYNCLPFKAVSAVCLPCMSATCIMLHALSLTVNTFFIFFFYVNITPSLSLTYKFFCCFYIRSKTQSITAKKVGISHLLDYMASSCQLPSVVIFNS